jgi:hypothetical protein
MNNNTLTYSRNRPRKGTLCLERAKRKVDSGFKRSRYVLLIRFLGFSLSRRSFQVNRAKKTMKTLPVMLSPRSRRLSLSTIHSDTDTSTHLLFDFLLLPEPLIPSPMFPHLSRSSGVPVASSDIAIDWLAFLPYTFHRFLRFPNQRPT